MSSYLGELAAIATAFFFAASSTVNTLAGRQVGASLLNRSRVLLAIIWLLIAHALFGLPVPLHSGADHWVWLSLSGIVGLAIGDAFLFQAFVWIGARLSMLLMALAPALAAILAWVFLGETLNIGQLAGMVVTLGGIAWVILDHNGKKNDNPVERKYYIAGILFGLGAAVGQAGGLVLAKRGLGDNFPALSASLIRMLTAAVVLWGLAFLQGQGRKSFTTLAQQPKASGWILLGSFLGPFLGVTLSLFAIQHTEIGVASTLTALPPVILLPVGYFFFKERFGWTAVLGTLLAMLGVAVFFLV